MQSNRFANRASTDADAFGQAGDYKGSGKRNGAEGTGALFVVLLVTAAAPLPR
jgi:hypothetical protein